MQAKKESDVYRLNNLHAMLEEKDLGLRITVIYCTVIGKQYLNPRLDFAMIVPFEFEISSGRARILQVNTSPGNCSG